MAENWEIREARVYCLYLDGQPVRDVHGAVKHYATEAEARHVADNWGGYRAPTYAELKAMSDDELMRRGGL